MEELNENQQKLKVLFEVTNHVALTKKEHRELEMYYLEILNALKDYESEYSTKDISN